MYNPNYGGFKLYFPQGWTTCKLYFFHKSVNVPANGDKSVKFEYPNIGGIPYVFVTPYVENAVWSYCTYMISSLTVTGGYVNIHNLEGTAHDVNMVWINTGVQYRFKVNDNGIAYYRYDGSTWRYIWGK